MDKISASPARTGRYKYINEWSVVENETRSFKYGPGRSVKNTVHYSSNRANYYNDYRSFTPEAEQAPRSEFRMSRKIFDIS